MFLFKKKSSINEKDLSHVKELIRSLSDTLSYRPEIWCGVFGLQRKNETSEWLEKQIYDFKISLKASIVLRLPAATYGETPTTKEVAEQASLLENKVREFMKEVTEEIEEKHWITEEIRELLSDNQSFDGFQKLVDEAAKEHIEESLEFYLRWCR
ncbi:MAG: hypothetical protein WD335_02310 [Candidatus Paceibacterota bacterium]